MTLANGLIGHWSPTLDGAAGTSSVPDRSTLANPMLLRGSAATLADPAPAFGGTHVIDFTNTTRNNNGAIANRIEYDSVLTFSIWMNWKGAVGAQAVWDFQDRSDGNEPGTRFVPNNPVSDWRVYEGPGTSKRSITQDSGNMGPADGWFHLVWLTDAVSSQYYVNGVALGMLGGFNGPLLQTNPNNSSERWFGEDQPPTIAIPFGGHMDTVRIYNRALTAGEVGQLFTAGRNEVGLGGDPPVNTVLPVVTGNTWVGQTLTTTDGTWTGNPAPTFTYQWEANKTPIVGAESSTYLLTANEVGKRLRCVVTGTNGSGTADATSDQTGQVTASAPTEGECDFGLAFGHLGAAVGTKDLIDPQFAGTPKGVFGHCLGINPGVDKQTHMRHSFGMADATDEAMFYGHSFAQAGSNSTGKWAMTTRNGGIYAGNRNYEMLHAFTAFGVSRVTYDVLESRPSVDWRSISLLFGGTGMNVASGNLDTGSLTAGQTLTTSVGFDMTNGVLILTGNDTGFQAGLEPLQAGVRNAYGFGSTTDGITFNQAAMIHAGRNLSNVGQQQARLFTNRIYSRINDNTGAVEASVEWTDADSDGFTLTNRDGTVGGGPTAYVALGLPAGWESFVSVEDLAASTGAQSFDPGFTFTPTFLMQVLTNMEAVNTSLSNNALAGSMGLRYVKANGEELSHSWNDFNGTPKDSQTRFEFDRAYLDNHQTDNTSYEMTNTALRAGGWDDNIVTAPAAAKKLISLAIGQTGVTPTPTGSKFLLLPM